MKDFEAINLRKTQYFSYRYFRIRAKPGESWAILKHQSSHNPIKQTFEDNSENFLISVRLGDLDKVSVGVAFNKLGRPEPPTRGWLWWDRSRQAKAAQSN